MGAFLKVLQADCRSFVPWVLWASVSLAVGVSGPFGSYSVMGLAERILFWTPVIGLAIAVTSVIRAAIYGAMGLGGRWTGTALGAVLNCLVLVPPLYLLVQAMFPPMFTSWDHLAEIILLVGSMSLGVCVLRDSAPEPVAAPETDVSQTPLPRLLRRLEADKQGQIWAITVRDHYVDVQTSLGKSSLLMRFSDAIDEVDDIPGAQVHRSHWVAWDGVGSVCREGGKINLHLKNGHQVPVSRNNRHKVDTVFPPMLNQKDVAA